MSIMKKRKPRLNRYSTVSYQLENSLLNVGKNEWIDTKNLEVSHGKYNVVDLFCGCGGASEGFEEAGFNTILGIDVDPGSSASYRNNFDAMQIEGRIEKISSQTIKTILIDQEVHVLLAGFPCPGFSMAGKKDDDDPRNFLYREVVRFVEDIKPVFLVMENVPRLVKLEKFLYAIYDDFTKLGYNMSVLIHEAAAYETPQIRPRVFFIGNRLGLKNPRPKKILDQSNYLSIESAIGDLMDKDRDFSINHNWSKHSDKTIERISHIEPGMSLYKSYHDAFKRQYRGVPSMTVKENHGGTHIHYELNRCISAREMARLQGFPDDFIFEGTMKRVIFQIGNAVPVPLAKHIGLALIKHLENNNILGNLTNDDEKSENILFPIECSYTPDEKISSINDVYYDQINNNILYVPLSGKTKDDVTNSRNYIMGNTDYGYIGTKISYDEVSNKPQSNRRIVGTFRKYAWINANYRIIKKPSILDKIEKKLNADSNWLSGGPLPEYDEFKL